MASKKRLFIYPVSAETYKEGANNYIRNLVSHLSNQYTIINRPTKIGLLDPLFKINQYDIIYFNWIEDLPHRRFGLLQVPLLILLLAAAKILNIKVLWFVHNNVSHNKRYFIAKSIIIKLLEKFSDLIITHSGKLTLTTKKQVHTFHHPIDKYQPVIPGRPYLYDILIWGTVSPYKGISEFIEYAATSPALEEFTILVAGKFNSDDYYEYLNRMKPSNITIINKLLKEQELAGLFSECRYILFTYNSSSVLSSASLCKTLSFGKEVIGPAIGSFKELGDLGLLYNYDSFPSLEVLLNGLEAHTVKRVDEQHLVSYISNHTWEHFADFLSNTINSSFKGYKQGNQLKVHGNS